MYPALPPTVVNVAIDLANVFVLTLEMELRFFRELREVKNLVAVRNDFSCCEPMLIDQADGFSGSRRLVYHDGKDYGQNLDLETSCFRRHGRFLDSSSKWMDRVLTVIARWSTVDELVKLSTAWRTSDKSSIAPARRPDFDGKSTISEQACQKRSIARR